MAVTFRYLFNHEGARQKEDVLTENIGPQDLNRGVFVVRDEGARKFRAFPTVQEFWAWSDQQPAEDRHYHEVIFGTRAQRIKLDIDAKPEAIDGLPKTLIDRITAGERKDAYDAQLAEEAIDELIFGHAPATGVDGPTTGAKLEAPPEVDTRARALAVLRMIVGMLVDVFNARYFMRGMGLDEADVVVASSIGVPWDECAGVQPKKYSFHVIVPGYFMANSAEAKELTQDLLAQLELEAPEVVPLLDPGVNSATQNFRLLGSSKAPGTGGASAPRMKIIDLGLARDLGTMAPESVAEARALTTISTGGCRAVGAVGGGACSPPRTLPQMVSSDAVKDEVMIADTDVNTILGALHSARPDIKYYHRFVRNSGALLFFERISPSSCRICKRVHDHDNTLMVLLRPGADAASGGGQVTEIVELCRRAPGRGELIATAEVAPGTFAADGRRTGPASQADKKRESRLRAVVRYYSEGRCEGPAGSAIAGMQRDVLIESACRATSAVTEYSEPAIRDYELVPTLAVRAQMGLGKTRALRRYLDAHFPLQSASAGAGDGGYSDTGALEPPKIIRFITFRQTFSDSLRDAFREFTVYSDVNVPQIRAAAHPRAIVQVESLHRLLDDARSGANVPDLVIMDECESVLAQFSSGLHKSFHEAFTVFQWLMARAKHVICMDANLGDRTHRTLMSLRAHSPPYLHWNQFQRARGDKVRLTTKHDEWLAHMVTQIGNGKRVVLASNSRREANSVSRMLGKRFPQKAIRVYSAETPAPAEKLLHFSDVDTYWRGLDVLIYTPTVSAGVSYEVSGADAYDCMYMYLNSMSCDVETSRQMMGRVRALRDREYFVCVRATPASLPVDIESLERLAYSRRRSLLDAAWSGAGTAPGRFRFDPSTGEVHRYRTPFFSLWLENARVANLSRNAYGERFVQQVYDTGAEVHWLELQDVLDGVDVEDAEDLCKSLMKEKKGAATELSEEEAKGIADAVDITSEEMADLRRRQEDSRTATGMATAQPLTGEEYLMMQRFQLRQRFHWTREIDMELVRTMLRSGVQRIFRNLEVAGGARTMLEALEALREREATYHIASTTTASAGRRQAGTQQLAERLEQLDIRHNYQFPAHRLAHWLLGMCGFRSVADKQRLPTTWVTMRLWGGRLALASNTGNIINEMANMGGAMRRPPQRQLVSADPCESAKSGLQMANGVLRRMYGIELRMCRATGCYTIVPTADGALVWPVEYWPERSHKNFLVASPRASICLELLRGSEQNESVLHLYYMHAKRDEEIGLSADPDIESVEVSAEEF